MHDTHADFTNTFRALSVAGADPGDPALTADAAFQAWHGQWQARLARQPQTAEAAAAVMQRHNPAVIPRNHKVEEALTAASERGDLGPLERLLAAVAAPYDHAWARPGFTEPAGPGGRSYRTFCGT